MKKSLSSARPSRLALTIIITVTVLLAAGFATRTAFMQGNTSQREASTTVVAERPTEWVGVKGGHLATRTPEPENDEAPSTATTKPNALEVASNYAFATATNASFTDMSSGTTQLIAADQDDIASAVTFIGFDFYFQGVRQDRFSVNSNGTLRFGATTIGPTMYDPLGQSSQSLITAYGADQRTHAGDGKVHFKVTGAEPNRVLIVEWLNTQANFSVGGTADLSYQVRLYETTGAIEFVYGSMSMSAAGAADMNSQSPQMGFSSSNSVGTVGSITADQSGTPAPTFSGSSATPVNNLYVSGPIPVLTSAADGSRHIFTLTPPVGTAPGGPLTFSGVSATSMTLNWTDSPDELSYVIYISTDGTNYNFFNTAAQNAASLVVSGLLGPVTYSWKVYAVTEGSTAFISGTQATNAPTPNSSVGSGLWSSPANWSTGSVPSTNDAVTITAGTTVTIDTAASAYSLDIPSASVLQFEQTTARTFTIATDVTIQNGGTVQSNPAGTQTGHNLSIAGNLTNNGTLDLSTNADTAGAIVTFTGVSNTTFSGTGATNDIRQIAINKGTTNAPILEITTANFTVRGVTTDTVVGGWLVMTSGTIKMSGTFSGTSRVFSASGYTIPAISGFWLNNPNYTVAGQNGSPTNNGLLRISSGTFNIGTATNNSMGFSTGSTITIEGGAVSATGRFGVTAAGTPIGYTQTAGIVTVCTIGNTSPTLGSFDLGTSTASTVSLSGGTIVVQLAATAIDYRDQAGSGIAGLAGGGTLQLGNAASGTAKTFNLRGVLPNVLVSNTSAGHTAVLSTTLANFNNTVLNVTITPGATFNIGNTTLFMDGAAMTNNGTLSGTGVNSNFVWRDNGVGAQTYTGNGVTTAPISSITVQNIAGVTLTSTNSMIANRINFLAGGFINSNKITIGNGGATTAVIQLGQNNPTQAVSGFDVPPVFNPGTGGVNILYAPELTGRSTGNEIPPSRTLNLIGITNPNNITIAGGDITVNGVGAGAIALNGGRVITGANTLYFNSAVGTVSQTTGYVEGNFKKSYAAAGSKLFEVGTANGFSPVTVNATAGTFPADFTVAAIQGPDPVVNAGTSIQRYWRLTATGVTADLTFQYLVGDVMGTEGNYKVIRESFGTAVAFPTSTVNTGAHTATLTGASDFSNWTVGEIAIPTAAPATISGLITSSYGVPLGGVSVNLSGGHLNMPTRTITDGNGRYHFPNVETNGFYVVTPGLANYSFNPTNRSVSLLANVTDAVFMGSLNSMISGNVIDSPEYFVRQHYLDFLNREPDNAGFNFWSDQISGCGNDFNCIERRTINVSAAYFLSIEFQKTGGLVEGLYRASYARAPHYSEFVPDTATVAHNLIVNEPGWEQTLTNNTQEFLDAWVARAAFRAEYDNLGNEEYVDRLISNTGVGLPAPERASLLTGLSDGTLSRAQVLLRIVDDERFVKARFNEAFVRMQYFGYLRRDPDDAGLHFWLNKLNEFEGNFVRAEMVKAFLVSGEYRDRFRQ